MIAVVGFFGMGLMSNGIFFSRMIDDWNTKD